LQYTVLDSPIGELLLVGDRDVLHGLHMQDGPGAVLPAPSWRRDPRAFVGLAHQLSEYFAGERTTFDVAVAVQGTACQRRVWSALREIGYGETLTYGELALRIGLPSGARAVGAANGRNPVSVIVPCHRLLGADGSLTGYGGGIQRKRWLLELERREVVRDRGTVAAAPRSPPGRGT
jgi:methylated-DNA-[protein]-cysteine S-methyltransferase